MPCVSQMAVCFCNKKRVPYDSNVRNEELYAYVDETYAESLFCFIRKKRPMKQNTHMDVYLARRKTAARAGVSWQGAPGNRIFMKENKINRRNNMEFLWEGVMAITPQQVVMYLIGGLLIWLAVKKEYEPALLLPMGFGAIMVNLPLSGVINQVTEGIGETQGIIQWLFETTISASEALPILLFIGIGAMI